VVPVSARRTAIASLLTALLCLVSQVAGVAHLGLVAHVRCLEHDALVHARPGDSVGHQAAPAAGPIARGVPADIEGHDDDHCLAVGLGRRDQALMPVPVASAATASAPQPSPAARPPVLVPERPVALLRLAPKASPPALG
jgi:hypothetical protein